MVDCSGGRRVAKLQSTKLLQSVRRGDVSRLETILSRGVTQLVNLLHPIYANSPLIVAAVEGNAAVVDLLLSRGADPDLNDTEGRTAVMHAASYGHVDCVTKLIEAGASVIHEDHDARGNVSCYLSSAVAAEQSYFSSPIDFSFSLKKIRVLVKRIVIIFVFVLVFSNENSSAEEVLFLVACVSFDYGYVRLLVTLQYKKLSYR